MIALWDLGNVVVNWDPEGILKSLEFTESQTDYVRHQLLGHPDWLDIDRGVKTEDSVAARLLAESDLTIEQILFCFDTIRNSLQDIPRTIDMIRQIKVTGVPMYVLSNMGERNYQYLKPREYFTWFDGVVISAHEKLIKPEQELFELVLERYSLTASEVFFVDDSLPNIEAARSVGMQALHFKRSEACYQAISEAFDL
ncbi:hypothetical protein AB833_16215 [Chromatiales bacterium (ex Bugula neritina AB1)]|nr:hypothetical protein AB833_16215 [Chromatiales bacterium (ex Bugula neritina AB1)]